MELAKARFGGNDADRSFMRQVLTISSGALIISSSELIIAPTEPAAAPPRSSTSSMGGPLQQHERLRALLTETASVLSRESAIPRGAEDFAPALADPQTAQTSYMRRFASPGLADRVRHLGAARAHRGAGSDASLLSFGSTILPFNATRLDMSAKGQRRRFDRAPSTSGPPS